VRVVAALGGNALLQRGEALTAENQRRNVRAAARALAPIAREHELVISHGNGPQVGLLALQGSAYTKVEPYPLDVLDAETEGMIGYVLQQELGNELPPEKPIVTLLTQIEVDPADPAFGDPSKPIGPLYTAEQAEELRAAQGWTFKPDGESMRRVVPSPQPQRIFGIEPVQWMLDHGAVVVCSGGGGIPVAYTDEPVPAGRRLVGVEAVIDKDIASAHLAADIGADVLAIITDVDAVYVDWGTPRSRAISHASPAALASTDFAAGSMGPKVGAACWFVERTGRRAAIGSIEEAAKLVSGDAGTIISGDAGGVELAAGPAEV
jgi:carbamate kinase